MRLSNYSSDAVTVAQTDAGYSVGLVTAGTKPRAILYLSAYDGTNTASSTIGFGVRNEGGPGDQVQVNPPPADPFYFTIYANTTFGSTTTIAPDLMAPFHAKGNLTAPALIIPPGHCFCLAVKGTNLNGTVVVQVITAEID